MKSITTILLLYIFIPTILYPQSSVNIDFNNLKMPISNSGFLAYPSACEFEESKVLYRGGFLISGYVNDTLWAKTNNYGFDGGYNFQPGNVDSNQYDPRYDIYIVRKNDEPFGFQWQKWAFAVANGADYYDGDNNGIYEPVDLNMNGEWDLEEDRPDIIGNSNSVAWCVYNDGYSGEYAQLKESPLGIEVKQTVFGFSFPLSQLYNVLFIRYKIENTGNFSEVLDSVYFSSWADPDIGYYYDDLIASDSLLECCIIYNDSSDYYYGDNPPAFLIPILQGPAAYFPGETYIDNNSNGIYDPGVDTALDTAYNQRGHLGIEVFPGAKNLAMTSFNSYYRYEHITGIFRNKYQVRNHQKGLYITGEPVDPCTYPPGAVMGGINCNDVDQFFWFSGDPLTQTGWIDTLSSDYRITVNTGPFVLKENEPITIIIAYIAGRDTSSISSILAAKNILNDVIEFYKNNFGEDPVFVDDEDIAIINDYQLYQNYPNPFNPTTTFNYEIPEISFVTIKVYDVLGNKIAVLVNEEKAAGIYEVEFNAAKLSSGIYFYILQTGSFFETKKMVLLK